jgi:glycosyltransferase involved in cell wall biosynthesis/LmbE family N-acetylglucosaminyl deacetylase
MVCLHTSPAESPGAGDAGGMNVVVAHEARALAALGHTVDLITRRSLPDQPDAIELSPGVTLRHLTAGPTAPLAKSAIDAYIPDFTEALTTLTESLAGPADDAQPDATPTDLPDAPPPADRSGDGSPFDHTTATDPPSPLPPEPNGTADRRPPYDLIHSQHWMSGVAALPVARAWGIPHVQSYHSVAARPGSALSEGEPPESPPRVPGEALLARESDLVIAISAAEARTVIERCGGQPDRVAIVPPGVDGTLFHPAEANVREAELAARLAPHGHGSVVFAGRLQPLKGPDLAIAALAHIPEAIRPDLIVAGAASLDFADYTAHLHRLVAELDLSAYVHFAGPQDRAQLADLLRGASLCLVPSHSETFGLIALEAAAAGTPVIAAAAGGLREAVVHGETGQLMDSRQPEDWAIAMMKLLTQPHLLDRMGLVARIHARRYTWEAMASNLTRLYTDLVSVHSHRRRPRRYLFVHAHPDDETLSTGAIILALRRQGAEPLVVTATLGERGEVVSTVAQCLGQAGLPPYRLIERTRALAALGAGDAGFLGQGPNRAAGLACRTYVDSGMTWLTPDQAGPAPDAPAEALTRAPLAELIDDVVATARHWRADVLVSYDAAGGYGHPDHRRCHEATVQAAAALGLPFLEVVEDDTIVDSPAPTAGTISVAYDVGPDRDRLVAAHRSYASQFTVDPTGQHLVHVGGQTAALVTQAILRPLG